MSRQDDGGGYEVAKESRCNNFAYDPEAGLKRAKTISDCVKKINKMKQDQKNE